MGTNVSRCARNGKDLNHMERYYIRNRWCPCARCKANDLMWPLIMLTIGILLLLDVLDVRGFHYMYPLLFIVIGGVLLMRSSASMEGHRNPGESTLPGDNAPAATNPPASSGEWS